MDHLESILSAPDPREIGRLIETARRALAHAWEVDVTLFLQGPIRAAKGGWRHSLLLCNVDGPDWAPEMVVVKAATERNNAIFNEWAVLQWLNQIEQVASLIPDFYAGDSETQLIVIEDLGAGPTLQRLLETRPEWAVTALTESQQLLATLHSATRGRRAELHEVRAALPEGPPPPRFELSPEALRAELEAWGGALSPSVSGEVDTVSATLDALESFRSLTSFDACAPNFIVTSAGVRAVDFEMAGFRHPLIDGAYSAIAHLRCSIPRLRRDHGLSFPPRVRDLASEAYRTAVLTGYPEYQDPVRFQEDLAAAAAWWMIEILRRMRPRTEGNKPCRFFGVTSCQRVLATLAAFAEVASSTGRLPALAGWTSELGRRLESEWPAYPPLAVAAGLL